MQKNQEHSTNVKEKNSSISRKKILLVDDEPDITTSLKVGLEDKGFEVDIFNDATLAISNFKPGVCDLVLLDVKMPRINGFELYEKIKEIDSKVKACFITAHEVYYESLKDLLPLRFNITAICIGVLKQWEIIHKPGNGLFVCKEH